MLRCLAVSTLLVAFRLSAQNLPATHFVRASGQALLSVPPDRAEVEIGVVTRANTAQAAASQNASQSSGVLTSLRQALGAGGDVKTLGYSIAPQYEYVNGRAPRLTAYEARNTVLVTVDQLSLLGKVIDAATGTGANDIHGISFTLRDDSTVRAEALRQAAAKARSNAEVLAKALGVQVVGVLQAEPTEVPVRPVFKSIQAASAGLQRTETPIEAGNLDIRATVTVTLEIR